MQTYWWVILIALLVVGVVVYRPRPQVSETKASLKPDLEADESVPEPNVRTVSAAAHEESDAKSPADASADASAMPNIAAAIGPPDNLLHIKGIGPKLSALCHKLGVTRFDQIAKWGPDEIAEVDRHLGAFRGRIERDNWVEQAGLLASGQYPAFEAKFGKLDNEKK